MHHHDSISESATLTNAGLEGVRTARSNDHNEIRIHGHFTETHLQNSMADVAVTPRNGFQRLAASGADDTQLYSPHHL
jgi:hypothetical protein